MKPFSQAARSISGYDNSGVLQRSSPQKKSLDIFNDSGHYSKVFFVVGGDDADILNKTNDQGSQQQGLPYFYSNVKFA